ncbi:FeoA family protein [Cellulomonas sp. PSBB021]|uniref:FeoA family protein n=1 Tax=Cellulomonas sp. PSBB021 TaxID=2003551 RepID=UPI000B8DAF4B|nr:FeoA family protein [Cellulomonas sp. PSBB021]ASR55793.1 FeoA family protein [Cellulomonas sp. PSBB021]
MDLAACDPGSSVRVVHVDLDETARRRLRTFGLAVGAVLHVTHRGGFGGRVVGVGADRLALDAGTCRRVSVEPVARSVAGA